MLMNILQLNDLLDWIWCDIDQRIPIWTLASPRSILVFSGRYHAMSNASIINKCIVLHVLGRNPLARTNRISVVLCIRINT